MPNPQDEFLKDPEILVEQQSSLSPIIRRSGGFLDLLSGIFVVGTIVIGLLFTVIFINPQSNLNPLSPVIMSIPVLTNTPISTPNPVLPPTWTPTIVPTDTPTLTQIPADTPISIIDNTPTPAADLESDVTLDQQDVSSNSGIDMVQNENGCDPLRTERQVFDVDSLPESTQLAPLINQTQVTSNLTVPIPAGEILTKDLPSDTGISDLFTPEIQFWEKDILVWGEEFDLDPNLIATVMLLESCGYTKAKSVAGAVGLFQVMPQYFEKNEDPYDPAINAFRGLNWLQTTLKSGGSISMALAGYNAGLARARNPYLAWPDETLRYVNWGLNIYQDTKCGYDYSSALEHWLSKGGSILCYRAAVEQQDK